MKKMPRHVLALLAFGVPLLAFAASSAQQELREAVRAKPNLERGAVLFENCALCHGGDGGGMTDGNVPRIAGQHAQVIINQLVDYRHDKRWDPRMERYADKHLLETPQDIADVAAYASSLNRKIPRGIGDGSLLERGRTLYQAKCRSCHGASGEGDEKKLIPNVAEQHYEYVLRQMYDATDGRRPNFSRAHVRLLGALDHDDLIALADAMSRADFAAPLSP